CPLSTVINTMKKAFELLMIAAIVCLGLLWPKNTTFLAWSTEKEEQLLGKSVSVDTTNHEFVCYSPEQPYLSACASIIDKNERYQCSNRELMTFIMENFC